MSYSPKLPLTFDPVTKTFGTNKTIVSAIKQNLKMLLLTEPGEKMMDPEFGVGLKKFLFGQDIEALRGSIRNKIVSQVNKYLDFITIEEIVLSPPESNDYNTIYVMLKYRIRGIKTSETLSLEIN
jgi:phage baseplate assembly protein W